MHGCVDMLFSAAMKHESLQRWITKCATAFYIHYTIATLYFGEIVACSICCQKQKYSAEVPPNFRRTSVEVQPNFGTRSAPSAKTSALAEHYKGMFSAPLVSTHLLIHLSAHLYHHHHSHHPSLLHSFTQGSKPTFSTNPSHLGLILPTGLPSW